MFSGKNESDCIAYSISLVYPKYFTLKTFAICFCSQFLHIKDDQTPTLVNQETNELNANKMRSVGFFKIAVFLLNINRIYV